MGTIRENAHRPAIRRADRHRWLRPIVTTGRLATVLGTRASCVHGRSADGAGGCAVRWLDRGAAGGGVREMPGEVLVALAQWAGQTVAAGAVSDVWESARGKF